ncbi:MAG: WecB/TagA/CpsF family glycosyltransferase [Actinomycetota bacterium]|nr:WecB/TagA/CpsF family glycosyltransferase [Actinomycetota bacterium]
MQLAEGLRPHHSNASTSVIVNGVRIDPIPKSEVPGTIGRLLDCGRSHTVHFLAADPTVVALSDRTYRDVLNAGDLNLPDGMPVAWAARWAGARAERVPGTDTMLQLTSWGVDRGVRHHFFGAAPGVAERLARVLERRAPGLRCVGTGSPPFRPLDAGELDDYARRIREAGTDLLWIGVGSPKQDQMALELAAREAAPVILCVGAAFDFIAGTKRRPPVWMQRAGLEWLGRLASEPRRLWRRYLIGNVRFAAGVISQRPRIASGRAAQPGSDA